MAEVKSGVRAILEIPAIYTLFQKTISRKPIWPDLIEEFLFAESLSWPVLDIGCGPGSFLREGYLSLEQDNFYGIDPSAEYIASARRDFPRAHFFEGTVENVPLDDLHFDFVVLSGVLHHLSDSEAANVMNYAVEHLSENGLVISLDPVTFPGQNRFARRMALADRGQNVRSEEELTKLWQENIGQHHLETHVKSGYLKVPYNHIVCVVRKSSE